MPADDRLLFTPIGIGNLTLPGRAVRYLDCYLSLAISWQSCHLSGRPPAVRSLMNVA
jgi:hypothetical protein